MDPSFLLGAAFLLGATGKHEGRKSPTSRQINSCNRSLCSFSFSNVKSNGLSATGSSSGLCNWDRKGCARAPSTVTHLRGWIWSIFRIRSNASGGVLGNWTLSGVGVLFGSFRINLLAFSEVTKSRSVSDSFPSFSVIIVNYKYKQIAKKQ